MNWKQKFRKPILEQGERLYKRNCVQELSYEDHVYKAKVIGGIAYDVEIEIRNEDIVYMKCPCFHALSGHYCGHMAAVMFAIDKKDEKPKPQKTDSYRQKVRPFEQEKETYQYFDMGRIAKEFEFSRNSYEDALKLKQKKIVILDRVVFGYPQFGNTEMLCGTAYGSCESGGYMRQISISFNRESILQANCEVPGCGGYYGNGYYYATKKICRHLLAMMLLLDEYLKKYNPGDFTDRCGNRFFQSFQSGHVRKVIENQTQQVQDLILEPVVEKGRDGLAAAFKAGTDKLYVVKNLTDFVKLYENQDVITFGTKTKIDLAKHRISDSCSEMFAYIQRIVREELNRETNIRMSPRYYYESSEEIKSCIRLYGDRLDQFYELNEGKEIACNDKSGGKTRKTTLWFRDGKPDICLQIEKNVDAEKVFHGVRVSGTLPELIQGNHYQYFFAEEAFCRMSDEMAREIQPVLELGKYGSFSLSVGRKHLSEFYHQVLPMLKRNVMVNEMEPEAIQEYIPPEAEFAFYLDVENGIITCRPKARYGEDTVSLLDSLKEDYVYEAFRNSNQEDEILYYVRQLFPEVDMEHDELHCGESEDAVLRLLDGGVERLMALGEVHTTERFRNMNIRKKPRLKIGISIESDIMNLSISSDDIDQRELLQILQSYKPRKKYYRLRKGDLIEVNDADMEMLQQMMETLQLSAKDFLKGDMKVPVYRALYLNKMLEQGEDVYLNRDKHFKNLIKEFKTVDDSEFEVPASLQAIMRNYQIRGFKWMKTLEHYGFGGILADDMGLGKTLQMISVLLSAKESGELGTALIVCPASLVYNWREEFARFAPELKVTLVVGTGQERAELIQNYQNSDVLVTSYDLLKRDIAEYESAKFHYQVLDEAQYIKNHSTAAAKSVKVIKSKQRYALTGTPIENRLSELWSIFDYLMPGFLYGYETFRKELEMPIVKYKEKNASERLKKMVAPFILRRLKGDVLKDLPDKMEEIRYAKLETEQQKLYDGQVLHMREMIASQDADDFQKNKLQVLAELTKIRQICCDPELLFEKYQGGSAKRMACMELIQSAMEGEHKILVFSQFTSMLELLERDLEQEKILYYKITGATPKEKRVEMVSAFNNDSTPVFLISLKAGGTGLNLTGADVVIHYDPWWNLAVQNQATDRAHRIGQSKVVSVYKLIVKDTIEEKIVKMQENKKDLADTVLGGETGQIAQMSKEELLKLLGA